MIVEKALKLYNDRQIGHIVSRRYYNVLLSSFGGDMEDFNSFCVLTIIEKIHNYNKKKGGLEKYIFYILFGALNNLHKAGNTNKRKGKTVNIDTVLFSLECPIKPFQEYEMEDLHKEIKQRLRAFKTQSDVDYGLVYEMYFIDDCSLQVIADKFDLTRQRIDQIIKSKIIPFLKENYKDLYNL